MAAQFQMTAQKRSKIGKGPNRRLRVAGQIPAVLYGKDLQPLSLAVDPKALRSAITGPFGMNTLLELDIQENGGSVEKRVALVREYQVHPVRQSFVHADFVAVDLTKPIMVRVPFEVIGKAKGVVDGGMVQIIRRDISISCLATDLPEVVQIDVSELDVGDSIHVGDVTLPSGVSTEDNAAWTVLTCAAPEVEKVEETEEAEGAVAEGEGAAADDDKKEGDKKEEAKKE